MASIPIPRLPSTLNLTNKRLSLTKTLLTLLFALNFLWLFTHFLHYPIPPINIHLYLHHQNHQSLNHHTQNHHHQNQNQKHHLSLSSFSKPWPILPSFLPWSSSSSSSQIHLQSCEGYFGNGFTQSADVIPRQGSGGWFRCHFSGTLQSSICEGGRVRMDPGRIRMSKGGENISEVVGRLDDDELPVFEPGSFRVLGKARDRPIGPKRAVSEEFLDRFVPEGMVMRHTMRDLIGSMELVDENEDQFHCSEWIQEPTLLVTRFEYANVFHTYTDWYSAYVSSRVIGLPVRPNVVFVDGHCKTQLEETWEALFSSIRFAKNFTGPVCFRHAILVPLGYETAWFKGLTESVDCHGASAQELWANPDDRKTARLSEFGEMIKSAFDLPVERQRSLKPSVEHNVLFIRREDYLAHPRHGGKVESRLSNEQEVFDSLQGWASNHTNCRVNLINGLFAHMPMREQIRAVQDASVIIGAHGAGLTHIVSALPKTVILEIISSQYRRPHFQLISQWKGLEYHAINLPGSDADPVEVIARLQGIMKSIGC